MAGNVQKSGGLKDHMANGPNCLYLSLDVIYLYPSLVYSHPVPFLFNRISYFILSFQIILPLFNGLDLTTHINSSDGSLHLANR